MALYKSWFDLIWFDLKGVIKSVFSVQFPSTKVQQYNYSTVTDNLLCENRNCWNAYMYHVVVPFISSSTVNIQLKILSFIFISTITCIHITCKNATIVSPPNVPVHSCWEMQCLANACHASAAQYRSRRFHYHRQQAHLSHIVYVYTLNLSHSCQMTKVHH